LVGAKGGMVIIACHVPMVVVLTVSGSDPDRRWIRVRAVSSATLAVHRVVIARQCTP